VQTPRGVTDLNPLLCAREDKERIEAANSAEQVLSIERLFEGRDPTDHFRVTTGMLRDLHRIAIEGLYRCAGNYRTVVHEVHIEGGPSIPPAAHVPHLVEEMLELLNTGFDDGLTRAAYVLWRVNAIHPFAGGNGRTARAMMHLVLRADLGRPLPGRPQMPTFIKEHKERYKAALREADEGYPSWETNRAPGHPYLYAVRSLVSDAWDAQFHGIWDEAKWDEGKWGP
jgi:Fic family protein